MATDRQLELALRVQADFKKAKTELHGLQREIKQVGTSSEQAAAGSKTQAAAISEQGKAARATTQALNTQAAGERKRFADLIHDSKAVEESERSIAERRSKAAGAAQALTQAQRDASVARARAAAVDRAAVKAQMADYAVLDKILAGNIKSRDELAAAEVVLDRLQKQGAVSTTELTAAFAALNKVTDKNTVANAANAASRRGLNSKAYAEIGTAASEVAAGNFGRLRRTGAAFLNQSGFFQKLFTPAGLAVTGLAAGVATLALAYKHTTDEISDTSRALVRSGNVSGITVGEIESLAASLEGVSHSTAVQTLTKLTASGRISADQLHKVGQAAVDFATLTDQSVADATDQILEMMKAPTKGAKAFDDATHSLTAAQLQEITTLENTGHRAEAAAKLLDAVAASTKNGAKQIRESLPWYDKLFHNIGTSSSNFFSQVGNILSGRNRYGFSAEDLKNPLNRQASLKAQAAKQLAELKDAIANYKGALSNNRSDMQRVYGADVKRYQHDLRETYSQLSKLEQSSTYVAAKRAEAAKKHAHEVEQAGKDAEATLRSLGITTTKMMTYAQKLQIARQSIVSMFDAGEKLPPGVQLNTATYEPFGPGWEKIKKKLRGPQQHDHAAERAANAATKSAAAANQQLRDSFIQLQAAQDPTAAAWARYNQVVDAAAKAETKANDALDKKVKLGALSVAAANAQKAVNAGLVRGIKVMAAATRDAAIDKLADKDRKAWEQFRASLQTPLEAHVNDAVAAIDMLNKHMAKGKMTADQYQGLVDRIFAKAAGQGSLRRVHTAGPAGGILDTQTQESADYQRQMDLIAGIRDKVLADEQANYAQRLAAQRAYEQASDRLTQLHAQNQQALERQKAQFALQAAQAGFGALAQAAAQAYGEHSKQARIAFALQKAAAVASASLAIEQSIANSAKIGYPWNIVAIAGAIAQGVAVLASVRSVQPGFAEGGYTGRGGKYQVAGVVHAGEGVLSQRDMAALGGPRAFDDFRRGLHGYADGGFVHPLANAPSPAQLGFSAPRLPKLAMPDASAAAGSGGAHHVKVVVVSNMEQAAIEAMNTPAGHKVIVQTAGDNPNAIKGKWGS